MKRKHNKENKGIQSDLENTCGLINTLFSTKIQDLFGSGFGLTSKDFELVFISG